MMEDTIYYQMLPDSDKEVLKIVARVAKEKISDDPHAHERTEFAWDVFEVFKNLGFTGTLIPAEYGGLGMGLLPFAMKTEIISRADAGIGLAPGTSQILFGFPIAVLGTEAQKQKFLPAIADGSELGCFPQTEPGAGSDVTMIKTEAKIEGDEIVLTGEKMFITNFNIARWGLVIARTDKNNKYGGLTAVVVDLKEGVQKGTITLGKELKKRGLHTSPTGPITFNGCRVPMENVIFGVGNGWTVSMTTLGLSRSIIAAQAVGVMQHAYDLAVDHASTREVFGGKLIEKQAVYMKIADMITGIDAARLVTYHAAWLTDQALSGGIAGLTPEKISLINKFASEAKLFAAETAVEVIRKANEIFGGYGYMMEYPIAGIRNDADVLTVYEGPSDIQRYAIAREELRKIAKIRL